MTKPREVSGRGQASGQSRWKVGGEDAILRGFQVVGRAVEVDDLRVGVEQCEGGAPVAVARLPDRAGIDQVSRRGLQLQRDGLGLPDRAVFGTEAIGAGTVGKESALQVGVAEEGQRLSV